MISYEDALRLISSSTKKLHQMTICLSDASGYRLAQEVRADRPYPPYNRAAMDGIAIRFQDYLDGVQNFNIQEVIYAGSASDGVLTHGNCYKIMTGAAVPSSADTIVRNEDLLYVANKASIVHHEKIKSHANIALRGQDLQSGQVVIPYNTYITPSIISLLATLGVTNPVVFRKPKVSVFTTGDEIVGLEESPNEVQIRNSNQYLLTALLAKDGIIPESIRHIKDTEADLYKGFMERMDSDIMLVNGGVSAGDRDLVPTVMKTLGAELLFHHVAIKPGKPLWCGKLPGGCLVFGIPGNPFSCLTTYILFIRPFLNSKPTSSVKFPLACDRIGKSTFDDFFPVQFSEEHKLAPIPINGSGDVRLGLFADGIARHHRANQILKKNDLISFYAF